ncbi:hypothetical protein CYMTET_21665 [Cymbomonas tetramitiformis]|uniref:Uncharacterized protein n=1 Tax=Cymbomonas tetramitiformis TaxID=36881 RepID=A0AAE0L2Y9_9CHLO|nr:hypothetical protein CYMTET_21665 [Cymbomonas tetramitiformis]
MDVTARSLRAGLQLRRLLPQPATSTTAYLLRPGALAQEGGLWRYPRRAGLEDYPYFWGWRNRVLRLRKVERVAVGGTLRRTVGRWQRACMTSAARKLDLLFFLQLWRHTIKVRCMLRRISTKWVRRGIWTLLAGRCFRWWGRWAKQVDIAYRHCRRMRCRRLLRRWCLLLAAARCCRSAIGRQRARGKHHLQRTHFRRWSECACRSRWRRHVIAWQSRRATGTAKALLRLSLCEWRRCQLHCKIARRAAAVKCGLLRLVVQEHRLRGVCHEWQHAAQDQASWALLEKQAYLRVLGGRVAEILHIWRQVARSAASLGLGIRRLARTRAETGIRTTLMHWREWCNLRSALRQLQLLCVQRFSGRFMAAALSAWQRHHALKVARRAVDRRRGSRCLDDSWHCWARAVQLHKFVAAMIGGSLKLASRRALEEWRWLLARGQGRRRALRQALRHVHRHTAGSALVAWSACARQAQRRAQCGLRVARVWRHHTLFRVVASWQELLKDRKDNELGALWQAWSTWRHGVARATASHRRVLGMAQRACWGLARTAWLAWVWCSASSRACRLDLARLSAKRMRGALARWV